jgi:hypothetical protein
MDEIASSRIAPRCYSHSPFGATKSPAKTFFLSQPQAGRSAEFSMD